MRIQTIRLPEKGICEEEELYFHSSGKLDIGRDEGKKGIVFSKGSCLWFDTYFNGFSIEKWMKYTVLEDVSLKLELKGKFKVTLFTREQEQENIKEHILGEYTVEAKECESISYDYSGADPKGMYAFKLESLEEGSVFVGGEYGSKVPEEKLRNVRLGVGICTFRRETYVERNLRILRESILENQASVLQNNLEVFISDNGKTLDMVKLATPHVHIFPNKNVGGAGGFTRDLIEMLKVKEELSLTHALLMDDDILIEPEALVKTYTILTILKEEYIDAFIGGAMLRLDQQYMQVECGASWNGGKQIANKEKQDLRRSDNCLLNEIEEYAEYNAWWYCCFPISIVREDNLPLPLFIRGDDIEYGLRNMKDLILMNGICVWHEPFENKYASFLEYYHIRNQLIDNSFHCPWFGKKQLIRDIIPHSMRELMYYRYRDAELYLQGIRDFLKGPEWLLQQDGEKLHHQLMAIGYKRQELKELPMSFDYDTYRNSLEMSDHSRRWRYRILTFNGLLFKTKGDTVVPMEAARTIQFYRMKRVLHYDIFTDKAFITEKKISTSLKYMLKTIGVVIAVLLKLKRAQEAYRKEGLKLRSLEFWNKYLGLDTASENKIFSQ